MKKKKIVEIVCTKISRSEVADVVCVFCAVFTVLSSSAATVTFEHSCLGLQAPSTSAEEKRLTFKNVLNKEVDFCCC